MQSTHSVRQLKSKRWGSCKYWIFHNSLHSNRLGTFFVGAVFAYVCLQACRVRLQKTTIQSEHMKRWAVPWMDICIYRSSGILNTIMMVQ